VQQGVETVPGSAYHVLSGVDGSILFDSGPAVAGLVTALPLGALPDGAALLEVAITGVDAGSDLVLTALDGTGKVLWTVQVDGLAQPVNAALDVHTGDLVGFTDLTGDAVPDVAVAVREGAGLALQAIDGLTGEVAWNLTIPDADEVVPVVVATAPTLAGQGADAITLASGAVDEAKAGATSALLALGTSATEATLTLVDPVTGAVQWVATAAVPAGAGLASLSVDAAGDLDSDGVQDLMVTANFNATGGAGMASSARASGSGLGADSDDAAGSPGSVTAVSGADGDTLYASSAGAGAAGLEYDSDAGPSGAASDEEDGGGNGIPGPGPALLAVALAVGVLWRRRHA
jgi:hypothetical protein